MVAGILETRKFRKSMNVPRTPKWVTPERQAYLAMMAVRQQYLSARHGKCTKAHTQEDHDQICARCWASLITPERVPEEIRRQRVELPLSIRAELAESPPRRYLMEDIVVCPILQTSTTMCPLTDCHYEYREERLVSDWSKQDADTRRALAEFERRLLHQEQGGRPGEVRGVRIGRNGTVSKEIEGDKAELYKIVGFGVSPANDNKPFAKVKLPHEETILFVDMGDTFKPLAAHKRKKIMKYGGNLPLDMASEVNRRCRMAVMAYLEQTV